MTTTARRKPEAVAKDGIENCLKWRSFESSPYAKNLYSWCPLRFQYALAQFVFAGLRSQALFLSLNATANAISWRPAAVFSGEKAGTRKDFEGGRIRSKRASCGLHHCVGDPASAGSDQGQVPSLENMNVVALRDGNLAAVVVDGRKWRTRRDQARPSVQRKILLRARDFIVGPTDALWSRRVLHLRVNYNGREITIAQCNNVHIFSQHGLPFCRFRRSPGSPTQ